MTAAEKKLLEHFFDDLSDKYGNAGCNDLNLKEFVPDLAERNAMVESFNRLNGGPPQDDIELRTPSEDDDEDYRLPDFCALLVVKHAALNP